MSVTTTTTASTHRRTASQFKLDSKPSAVHLFVKNVRLLDLDLLPDWPVVTPASLSNQDARARLRGTEWCLYQLFKVYDPAITTDKLQPFFPPLEPLQSINLRAALYRCLNELKRNGVLGRETVLRKSMLDDCQGDKFWELCLAFSALVLRKVNSEQHNGVGRPVAERIGSAQTLSRGQRDSMLPLSIAHRAALTKVLHQKEGKRDTFARLYDVLVEKDSDLLRRKAYVEEQSQQLLTSPSSRSEKLKVAQEVLDKQWVGSTEMQAALIYGGESTGGDYLLTTSFEDIWDANQQNRLSVLSTSEVGLIEDLDNRTRQQRQRLEKWQSFHEQLQQSRPISTHDAPVPKRDTPFCFDKHQGLTVSDMDDVSHSPAERQPRERTATLSRYDEILTAMREELRKNTGIGQTATRETLRESRRLSMRPSVSHEMSPSPDGGHRRSPSQTAVPMRPPLGRRVSSRSRSYNQPKVISQRELVPLKSELFSPLKSKRGSIIASSYGTGQMLTSPVEEPSNGHLDDILGNAHSHLRRGSETANQRDSAMGLVSRTSSTSGSSSPCGSRPLSDLPDSAVDVSSNRVSVASKASDGHSRAPRPSLAERTRMSMAFKSVAWEDELPPAAQTLNTKQMNNEGSDQIIAEPESSTALVDRTRQSISSMPPIAPLRVAKKSHARSRTSIYPINQFETPLKVRRSTINTDATGADTDEHGRDAPTLKRDFTPREKLFEANAEYDSVFKTRPKIALSPLLSPRDSGHVQMDDDELARKESPLGRM